MKKLLKSVLLCSALSTMACFSAVAEEHKDVNEILLTQKWDKTFKLSDKVVHSKVTFKTRFGTTIAADMYVPKSANGKLAAIAVCGPFGAVKEQSSGLYAQTMAEKGFLTIAFDPSFTGESSGTPRNMASPDINTEDFQASVDFLSNLENVDKDRIGIIGICGWGGLALKTAAIDTRIKATLASTMYDMSRVIRNGYFDSEDTKEKRHEKIEALNRQRTADFSSGKNERDGGLPDVLPEGAPQFVQDYYNYYKRPRGYHERSVNSNGGWARISALSFMNTHLLSTISEIDSAVMLVHGENAHSRYFSESAYNELKGNNKSLVIVPEASHTDLYDRTDVIPFRIIEEFFNTYLQNK